MKKVIAFSLWGNDPFYWVGARKNIDLAAKHYPDWICRFYVADNVPSELISSLKIGATEVVLMPQRHAFDGMFWRFLAASDPQVSHMISRDCDSRITSREVEAVNQWLYSQFDFHIMRDHPWHTVPILGGMWGVKRPLLGNMKLLIDSWNDFSKKGCDQDFLSEIIYPLVRRNSLEHSSFQIKFYNPIHDFPSNREGFDFVGNAYSVEDQPSQEYMTVLSSFKPKGELQFLFRNLLLKALRNQWL